MSSSFRRLYAMGAVGAVGTFLFLPDGGVGQAMIYAGMALGAAIVIALSVRARRPPRPGSWWLLAAGCALFAIGNLVWFSNPPFPSVVDALYISAYVLFAVALQLFGRRGARAGLAGVVDALIVTLGLAVLFWVLIAEPYVEDSSLSWLAKLVSLAYPVMDLLLVALLLRVVFTVARRTPALSYLGLAFGCQLVVDTGYALTLLDGTFYLGHPLSVIYLSSVFFFGAAALDPTMSGIGENAERFSSATKRWRVLVLGQAALLPTAMLIFELTRGETDDALIFGVISGMLFVLVLTRVGGLMSDLRQRRAIEVALRDAEKRYRTLVEQLPVVIYIDAIDELATTQYIAPTIERLTGFTASEWQAVPGMWLERMHPDDKERVLELHEESNRSGEPFEAEYRWFHRDGSIVWVRDESLVVIPDADGVPRYWQGVLVDITDEKLADEKRDKLEQELRHQALHDPLTGLPNRTLLGDRLEHALDRLARATTPLAMLLLDVDDFKSINDTLGHAAGDALLVQVAERLSASVRPGDTVARLGGDEFAILLEELSSREEAELVAARVLDALKPALVIGGDETFASASVGLAVDATRLWESQDFMRNADVAMYSAKAGGKGGYAVFEPGMHASLLQRVELEGDLRRALESGEIAVHYQPIVTLGSASIEGVEALARWTHPRRGPVPPNEFIPIAESTGLILALGKSILRQACRQVRAWQLEVPSCRHLTASVNLSFKQVVHPELVDEVSEALRESGLAPQHLMLEITESVLMERTEASIERLHALKSLGVMLAIDDFGTGYSSLAYLRRFPIDVLKIDKSFIDGVAGAAEDAGLARAIIRLGESLNLRTVAEGIETEEQLMELGRLGAHMGQGFHLARPLDPPALRSLLDEPRRVTSGSAGER
jgi:diguanylate cyclase (GGDEF)-like protein/PAS domain S-box-containing protein